MISRRFLSAFVLEEMTTAAAEVNVTAVGDAVHPDGNFGWDGQPGEPGSKFYPYVIVTPMQSSYSSGAIQGAQSDWRFPYSISSFGATRAQAEWLNDYLRDWLYTNTHRKTFTAEDGFKYTIQNVRIDMIGGIVRSDAVDPPVYGQTDVYSIWITKGRA